MNKTLMEQRIHGEADFPVSVYEHVFGVEDEILAPLHFHPEMEILVAKKGTLTLRFEERACEIREGEGIFVGGSKLHAIYGKKGEEKAFTAVVFSAKWLAAEGERIYAKYIEPIQRGEIILPECMEEKQVKMIERMAVAMKKQEYGYEMAVKAEILNIFSQMLVHASKTTEIKPHSYRYDGVKLAIAYMETHYMEEITLRQLADVAGWNREYFCRVFSEMAGETAFTYLNRFRIQKSMEYLKNTNKSIQEISELTGFRSVSYYSKTFFRFQGILPSKIRKNMM